MNCPDFCISNEKEIKGFFGENRFLSNFYKSIVFFEGKVYQSSEHAYQAAKTLDDEEREFVRRHSFKGLKEAGRSLNQRADWNEVKLKIMESILKDKFSRNHLIREMLRKTGKKHLEETNFWGDKFWGVCSKTGEGENNLGKILMKIRENLPEDEENPLTVI